MENLIIKPSYEEACNILKHIINVDFPTKENITHLFLQQQVLSSIIIWGNYSPEIKSALSVILNEVWKNEQSTTKVVPKDNTDHKLLLNYRKKDVISPIIGEIQHNKENTIENILPIQEKVIIKPKVEKITPIEKKKQDRKSVIQPIIQKEKVTINPDTKIWKKNIGVITGTNFTDNKRKIALITVHDLIKKYIWEDENDLFLKTYTKPDPQNKDDIVYRIQFIQMDILSTNHQKNFLQKIVMDIEKKLNIE